MTTSLTLRTFFFAQCFIPAVENKTQIKLTKTRDGTVANGNLHI